MIILPQTRGVVKYFFEIFLNNLFNQPLSFGQLY